MCIENGPLAIIHWYSGETKAPTKDSDMANLK